MKPLLICFCLSTSIVLLLVLNRLGDTAIQDQSLPVVAQEVLVYGLTSNYTLVETCRFNFLNTQSSYHLISLPID